MKHRVVSARDRIRVLARPEQNSHGAERGLSTVELELYAAAGNLRHGISVTEPLSQSDALTRNGARQKRIVLPTCGVGEQRREHEALLQPEVERQIL